MRDYFIARNKKDRCLFCYYDYEGNPPIERTYYCLIWNTITKHGQGYRPTAGADKQCTKDDFKKCPLFVGLIGNMLSCPLCGYINYEKF